MSVEGYLKRLASAAIVRDSERDRTYRSINSIQSRLQEHFGSQIKGQSIFGSFDRKTMLPRVMDPESDVDLMVIFNDSGVKPQAYIERLKRFADAYYTRSEIYRSHPTVALELSHIRFELVPGIEDWWDGTQIPAPKKDWSEWMQTEPEKLKDELTEKNKTHEGMIRPLIRILKYWNVLAGRPFESFQLEQRIIDTGYVSHLMYALGKRCGLPELLYTFAQSLGDITFWESGEWVDSVSEFREQVENIKDLQGAGHEAQAVAQFEAFLPLPKGVYARR